MSIRGVRRYAPRVSPPRARRRQSRRRGGASAARDPEALVEVGRLQRELGALVGRDVARLQQLADERGHAAARRRARHREFQPVGDEVPQRVGARRRAPRRRRLRGCRRGSSSASATAVDVRIRSPSTRHSTPLICVERRRRGRRGAVGRSDRPQLPRPGAAARARGTRPRRASPPAARAPPPPRAARPTRSPARRWEQ